MLEQNNNHYYDSQQEATPRLAVLAAALTGGRAHACVHSFRVG